MTSKARSNMKFASAFQRIHYLFFFSIYFLQGGVVAYFMFFFKAHLTQAGLTAAQVGLAAGLSVLPFTIKFIFAYVADTVKLRKERLRPHLFVGLGGMLVTLVLAAFCPPTSVPKLFVVLVFLTSCWMAFADAAVDGIALTLARPEEAPRVQATMTAARFVGLIFTSFILGRSGALHDPRMVFLYLAALSSFPLLLASAFPRLPLLSGAAASWKTIFTHFANTPNRRWGLLIILILSFFANGIDAVIGYGLTKWLQFADAQIGDYGMFRGLGAVVGCVTVLWALRRSKQVLHLSAFVCVGIGLASLTLPWVRDTSYLMLWAFGWGAVYSVAEFCTVTLAMLNSPRDFPATQFALIVAVANFANMISHATLTPLTASLGFASTYYVLAGAVAVAGGLVFFIAQKKTALPPQK